MKTLIVNPEDQTRIPFLRGILIRKLLDSGLSFDEANDLAITIRDELADVPEIAEDELQQRVAAHLQSLHGEQAVTDYLSPPIAPQKIQVRNQSGSVSAFSRGRHQRYLQSSAISLAKAEDITLKVFNELVSADVTEITTCQLGYLTYLCLRGEVGEQAALRYLRYSEFQRSDRPLILLICGAVGTGKSSITIELSHRMEIVRTQSTDMLREVMRSMVSSSLLPVLHRSSFRAWKALPLDDIKNRDRAQLVADGYRAQTELLSLACEAVLNRASTESTAMILEGVHAHPNLLNSLPEEGEPIAVHATLAVMKPKELRRRLRGRSNSEPKRAAKRYLKRFEDIWALQSSLLAEAERHETAIIVNHDMETAIYQLVNAVNHKLSRHFSGSPEDVFGHVVPDTLDNNVEDDWHRLIPALLESEEMTGQMRAPIPGVKKNTIRRILLIGDGLGDLPVPELNDQTPLEAAMTPNLNYFAGAGKYGLVDPIGPGVIPNTDTGTGLLMGLDPEETKLLRRGPIEAAGTGYPLEPGEIAFRANFATANKNGSEILISDRRAGREVFGLDQLAAEIADVELGDGVRARFYPTDQHRGVVVLSGDGLDPSVTDTDPGDSSLPAQIAWAKPERPGAERTAEKINQYLDSVRQKLLDHPVNAEREKQGLLPANCLITRGAGTRSELQNRYHNLGHRVALVAGCNTVLGLGSLFDFRLFRDESFTADTESDFDAKIKTAIAAGDEYDVVVVHLKAPDTCAHDLNPSGKMQIIEKLDRALEPLRNWQGVLALSADHTTDSNTGRHTTDPVPSMIVRLGKDNGDGRPDLNFGERVCQDGDLGRQNSQGFIREFLQ